MGDQGPANGQNVVRYYTMAFNDKNPARAVQLYGGADYIQHNPSRAPCAAGHNRQPAAGS